MLSEASSENVLSYLATRVEHGNSSRTTARLLSSLKRFYTLLCREGFISADPTALVDAPKTGRPLPDTLSEAQIEKLLAAPDLETAEGVRDRAMLELTYSSGLRVSELVGLRVQQLNLTAAVLRVVGKGNKERMLPIGDLAVEQLECYLQACLLYTSPSPRDRTRSRMPSSA